MPKRTPSTGFFSSCFAGKVGCPRQGIFGFAWVFHLIAQTSFSLCWLFFGVTVGAGLVALPLRAQPSVEMPQTTAFAEAYDTALALAGEFPGGRVITIASTYSMYPMLDWDSMVVVVPASLEQISVGDVVCFRDQRSDATRTILHRVERILVKDGRLVTHGDHLTRSDPHLVSADTLVGKAVYIVYFDRSGERRTVNFSMPAPKRPERIVKLFRD